MAIDIRALAALGAKIGMGLAGNAKVPITLHLGKAGPGADYDPATDTQAGDPAGVEISTDTRDASPLMGMPFNAKESQQPQVQMSEGDHTAYEHSLLVEPAALPSNTVINEDDYVTEDGVRFEIMEAKIDPGRGLWVLHLRR